MPGTLRNICMSVSLSGFQAGFVSSSTDTSTMSWCVLDSSLYWWFRLWCLRGFLVGCARFVCRGWEGSLLSFFPGWGFWDFFSSQVAPHWLLMHWGGFHDSKYDSQSHVLDFVQPTLVGLGGRSPHSGCILHGCSYCCCVHFGQKWWVSTPGSSCKLSHQGLFLQTTSLHLLYLWLPVSRVSSFTPRKVGVSVWGMISSFSRTLICSFEVEREKRVLFALLVFISRGPSPVSTCWYHW